MTLVAADRVCTDKVANKDALISVYQVGDLFQGMMTLAVWILEQPGLVGIAPFHR